MLRRGARKLAADLHACVESRARFTSTSGTQAKQKMKKKAAKDDALRTKMETRAGYLLEQILPRAYL